MPKQTQTKSTTTSLRLSDETKRQLDYLVASWGETQTAAITRMIERTYQQETRMNYKGFSIETFPTIGGYGWQATSEDYGAMGKPNASQNDTTTYTTEEAAQSAAKTAITQFLNSYHYEGPARF